MSRDNSHWINDFWNNLFPPRSQIDYLYLLQSSAPHTASQTRSSAPTAVAQNDHSTPRYQTARVHNQTSFDLLARLKSRRARHANITRGLIKKKLNEDANDEIATISLRVSLMCPLGKMRMSSPCRAKACTHLQCFDASVYLQIYKRKHIWRCPVCHKPAVYRDLYIDGYFQAVLDSPDVGTDITEIQLHKDGSWSVQNEVSSAPDDFIAIIDDDESSYNATSSTQSTRTSPPITVNSVVDLTLTDY